MVGITLLQEGTAAGMLRLTIWISITLKLPGCLSGTYFQWTIAGLGVVYRPLIPTLEEVGNTRY